jgi:hypothetical protein
LFCSGIFWMILILSHCHCYYCYHSCFYIPHTLSSYFQFLYFKILLAYLLIIFVSPKIALSISRPVPLSLSRIVISGLFVGMISVVDSMICLPDLHDLSLQILVPADACVHCPNLTPSSEHKLKCSWAHTLIMSLCIFFFYQYWAHWHYVVRCLVMLWTYSACMPSVAFFNTFLAWYLVCNAWSCAVYYFTCSCFRYSLSSPRKFNVLLTVHRNISV